VLSSKTSTVSALLAYGLGEDGHRHLLGITIGVSCGSTRRKKQLLGTTRLALLFV